MKIKFLRPLTPCVFKANEGRDKSKGRSLPIVNEDLENWIQRQVAARTQGINGLILCTNGGFTLTRQPVFSHPIGSPTLFPCLNQRGFWGSTHFQGPSCPQAPCMNALAYFYGSKLLTKKNMPLSWKEKLNRPAEPEITLVEKPMMGMKPGESLLIPTPRLLQESIQEIPFGSFWDIKSFRQDLARQFQVDHTCPLTTGIFLRVVAESAWDDFILNSPIEKITPFWRLIDPNSKLAQKLRCGTQWIQDIRQQEAAQNAQNQPFFKTP